jgi:hypothetical protein
MPYIYLIHCRASLNNNENVFKLGKSQDFNKRLDGYDKGSLPILSLFVNECDEFEKYLINLFDSKFKQRNDYGREYYEGEINIMINTLIQEYNLKNLCYIVNQKDTVPKQNIITTDFIMKIKTKFKNKLNKININNINSFQTNIMIYSSELNNNQYYHLINNYIQNYRYDINNNKKKIKFGDYLDTNYSFINNICNSINADNNNIKLIDKINLLI